MENAKRDLFIAVVGRLSTTSQRFKAVIDLIAPDYGQPYVSIHAGIAATRSTALVIARETGHLMSLRNDQGIQIYTANNVTKFPTISLPRSVIGERMNGDILASSVVSTSFLQELNGITQNSTLTVDFDEIIGHDFNGENQRRLKRMEFLRKVVKNGIPDDQEEIAIPIVQAVDDLQYANPIAIALEKSGLVKLGIKSGKNFDLGDDILYRGEIIDKYEEDILAGRITLSGTPHPYKYALENLLVGKNIDDIFTYDQFIQKASELGIEGGNPRALLKLFLASNNIEATQTRGEYKLKKQIVFVDPEKLSLTQGILEDENKLKPHLILAKIAYKLNQEGSEININTFRAKLKEINPEDETKDMAIIDFLRHNGNPNYEYDGEQRQTAIINRAQFNLIRQFIQLYDKHIELLKTKITTDEGRQEVLDIFSDVEYPTDENGLITPRLKDIQEMDPVRKAMIRFLTDRIIRKRREKADKK